MKNNIILVVDVGNTFIKMAYIQGNQVLKKIKIKTKLNYLDRELKILINSKLGIDKIDGIALGSVVPDLNDLMIHVLEWIFEMKVFLITSKVRLPIEIKTQYPEKVGTDIIALSSYSYQKNKNVLAFSLGTAMVGMFIEGNALVGVSIAPGANFGFQQLVNNANQLKSWDKSYQAINYGKNTNDAITAGYHHIIDGYVKNIYNHINETKTIHKVVVSGGDGELVKIPNVELNYDAILLGYKKIYDLNKSVS